MRINGLRWGFVNAGMTCIPDPGTDCVELLFMDGGQELVVTLIAQAGCMTIYLSKAPMNDVLPGDVREEEIPDQIRRPAKTELLGEIVLAQDEILYFKNDDPLEAYWREINSARLCLIACSNRNVTDNADEFIQSFLGREAEECYIDLFEAANQVNSESDDL